MQAAKTYLEKHYEAFPAASVEDLVQHGLKALAATLSEGELTKLNVSVAIVGKGAPYAVLEDDDVEPYLQLLKAEEDAGQAPMAADEAAAGADAAGPAAAAGGDAAAGADAAAGDAGDAPMETSES